MKNYSTLATIKKMRTPGEIIIVADTETTGFKVDKNPDTNTGDRMVEFGACFIKVVGDENGLFSHYELLEGKKAQMLYNPDRPAGAVHIHGLGDDILSRQQSFSEQAASFLDIIKGKVVIFHNAPFDVRFIDNELMRAGLSNMTDYCHVFDTLFYAQNKLGSGKSNLDALATKFNVENVRSLEGATPEEAEFLNERRLNAGGRQDIHGADVDALLLAKVFIALNNSENDLDLGLKISADPMTSPSDDKRTVDSGLMSQIPEINIDKSYLDADLQLMIEVGAIENKVEDTISFEL